VTASSAAATSPPAAAAGLEQTILPSPNVRPLLRTPKLDYQTRLADVRGSLAEEYHLNSRMRPWELAELPAPEDANAVRAWFLDSERSYRAQDLSSREDAPVVGLADLPAPVAALLARLAREQGGALYTADLMVVHADALLLLPPGGDALVFERRLVAGAARALGAHVPAEHREAIGSATCLLAIACVPWRHMVLFGERGFRRSLMETGILVSSVCGLAVQVGLRPSPVVDFVDTEVDRLLHHDGLERFCAALIALDVEERPA
jgi:hypothetical protein